MNYNKNEKSIAEIRKLVNENEYYPPFTDVFDDAEKCLTNCLINVEDEEIICILFDLLMKRKRNDDYKRAFSIVDYDTLHKGICFRRGYCYYVGMYTVQSLNKGFDLMLYGAVEDSEKIWMCSKVYAYRNWDNYERSLSVLKTLSTEGNIDATRLLILTYAEF